MQNNEEEESSEIKILAKNTAILATPKIIIFFLGLLKSKFIALFLGTAGFGIIDQLTNTLEFIRRTTLSFLPDGMVKLIAEERSQEFNHDLIGSIIKTFFYMLIPLVTVVVFLSLIFSDQITIFVFGDIKYKDYFLIGLVAIPISFFGISIGFLLKAFKEIKAIAKREIIIFIINFITFIPLVYYLKVLGGVLSISLSFLVSFVVNFLLVNKNVLKKYNISYVKIFNATFSNTYFRRLLTFIGVGLIGGTLRVFENMASRAIVVNELGIEKIGVYAPITKWEALFIGFILPSIYTYLYPRLSEAKSNKEITMVVNDVIRLITFLILPFIIMGIATREWIIPLFYSSDFLEASIYLPFHFSFLLFMVWGTIFEQIFAATDRLKIFLVFLIIIYSLSMFMVYFFVPKYGLYGYMLKYTITPFFVFVSFFVFWRREIKFRLRKENLYLATYALISSLVMLIVRNVNSYILFILGVVLLLVLITFLKKGEKKIITDKIKRR